MKNALSMAWRPAVWFCAAVAIASCSSWDLAPQIVTGNLPRYPATAELDYEPLPCMAHAACPLADETGELTASSGRIWLKGSAALRRASVPGKAEPVALDPPYYTAVVEAPPGKAIVEFSGEGGARRSVEVVVPDAREMTKTGEDFSILFFGDLQPFALEEGEVYVNPGDGTSRPGRKEGKFAALEEIRKVLRGVCEGTTGQMLRPSLIVGHGDQVYVEGAYEGYSKYGPAHPMAAWTMEFQPRPRVSPEGFPAFLDRCYGRTWSLTTIDAALRNVPSVMVWDDHDIRDGWGSQGDEHIYRETYFRAARDAYVAHQILRGPLRWGKDLEPLERSLHQSFRIKGLPVFVLDERNNRDVSVPSVLGEEQWKALRAWFQALDPARSKHYILVSSVPIFYRVAERVNIAASFTDEIRDDLLDTWTSAPNEPEWRELVREVVKAWERGLRAIVVSGDYHMSSICRVTSEDAAKSGRPVVAYEIITSGLAAEAYGGWKQKMGREGLFIDDPIEIEGHELECEFGQNDTLPNFGGIEFMRGEAEVSIFKAETDGCIQYKVPLRWEGKLEEIEEMVSRNERRIQVEGR